MESELVTLQILPAQFNGWQMIRDCFRSYGKHWYALTQPLLWPVIQVALGSYACIGFNYWLTEQFTLGVGAANVGSLLGLFALMALITIGTLWFVLRGFWQYLVYVVTLSQNAVEALNNQPIQPETHYQMFVKENAGPYQNLLLAYLAVPLLVFVLALALSAVFVGAANSPDWGVKALAVLLVVGLQFVSWLIIYVVMFLFTFIFQIAAFEPLSRNPVPVLKRSISLVAKRWPLLLGLHIGLWFITSLLAPGLMTLLLRVLWISRPLDGLNQWIFNIAFQGLGQLLPPDTQHLLPADVSTLIGGITDSILGMMITALLLPLGTLFFTYVYWDIYRSDTNVMPKKTEE